MIIGTTCVLFLIMIVCFASSLIMLVESLKNRAYICSAWYAFMIYISQHMIGEFYKTLIEQFARI